MSAIVHAAIATELALLERVRDAPEAPFGYGTDISCDSDLEDDLRDVDGFTTLALAQAILRRLDCPRGGLPDDPDYGIDLRSYCNRGVTADEVRGLATQIRNETEKDDRVSRVVVTLTPSPTGSSITVELAVTAVDPATGEFALTLSATSAAVLLEELRGRA